MNESKQAKLSKLAQLLSSLSYKPPIKPFGLIRAHGQSLTNKPFQVPLNLDICLPIKKGEDYDHSNFRNVHEKFKRKSKLNNLKTYFTDSESNSKYRIIKGGTIILDMCLSFCPFYGIDGIGINKIKDIARFSKCGIIFNPQNFNSLNADFSSKTSYDSIQKLSQSSIEKLQPSYSNKSEQNRILYKLQTETTKLHDNNIIPVELLYNKIFFLSDILTLLSSYKKHIDIPDLYYIFSCRGYKINKNNSELLPVSRPHPLIRSNSMNITYKDLFEDFCEKILLKIQHYKNMNNNIIININKQRLDTISILTQFLMRFNTIENHQFNYLIAFLQDNKDLFEEIERTCSLIPNYICSDNYSNVIRTIPRYNTGIEKREISLGSSIQDLVIF